MLVLTRKAREAVVVKTSDGPVTFTVADVRGGKVRVGVDAPKGCRIIRAELEPKGVGDDAKEE
jgi:carbon storage regulator CsrA